MNLEDILADLKKEYIAGLPERIKTITEHFQAGDASVLREDFHKLKGTGKTYGIPELSEVGEVGELICRDRAQNVAKALPLLLALISAIHESRARQQTFDLNADPRFSDLNRLK